VLFRSGLGDLSLCLLFNQMEAGSCIGGLALVETFLSLDRAALGFEEWTVTPIILRVCCFYFFFFFQCANRKDQLIDRC